MLKLIVGDKEKDCLRYSEQFIGTIYTSYLMNEITSALKKEIPEDWLNDSFCLKVLKDLEGVTKVIKGVPISPAGIPSEIDKLSYGTKLILMVYRNPHKIYRANFGYRIASYIEQLASKQDIIICTDSQVVFPFKYIKEIEIIEYKPTSHTIAHVHNMKELKELYSRYIY